MMALLLAALLAQDDLIERLRSDDPAVRREATDALTTTDPDDEALDKRIDALTRDADMELAGRARRILGYRRLARVVPDPAGILDDLQSPETRIDALYRLADAALAIEDPAAVDRLGDALRYLDASAWREELHQMAHEGDVQSALFVLGAIRDEPSIPLMLKLLKDGELRPEDGTSPSTRLHAAWALDRIASPESVASLLEIWALRRRELTDRRRPNELPFIIGALGRIGDRRAIPVLLEALDAPEEAVRYAAADALGRMRAAEAVAPLAARVDDLIGFRMYDPSPSAAWNRGWDWGENGLLDGPVVRDGVTVREAVLRALPLITGESFEGTPSEQAASWMQWAAERR